MSYIPLLFTSMTEISTCIIIVQNHTLFSHFVNAHLYTRITCIALLPFLLIISLFYLVNHNIHVYLLFLNLNALSLNLNTSEDYNSSSYVFRDLLTHVTYTQKIMIENIRKKVMHVQ